MTRRPDSTVRTRPMLAASVGCVAVAAAVWFSPGPHGQGERTPTTTPSRAAVALPTAPASAPPPTQTPTAQPPTATSAAQPTTGTSNPPQGGPELQVGQLTDADLQAQLDQSSPATIPDEQSADLLITARAALIADLTGVDREQFPSLFSGTQPEGTWSRVRARAGIVRAAGDDAQDVTATLLFTGTSPGGVTKTAKEWHVRIVWSGQTWVVLPSAS